jgi:hypothetical protein
MERRLKKLLWHIEDTRSQRDLPAGYEVELNKMKHYAENKQAARAKQFPRVLSIMQLATSMFRKRGFLTVLTPLFQVLNMRCVIRNFHFVLESGSKSGVYLYFGGETEIVKRSLQNVSYNLQVSTSWLFIPFKDVTMVRDDHICLRKSQTLILSRRPTCMLGKASAAI